MAWCSAAKVDMTVKMVVPTAGRRDGNDGVRGAAARNSVIGVLYLVLQLLSLE
jgi:hypothetical protein